MAKKWEHMVSTHNHYSHFNAGHEQESDTMRVCEYGDEGWELVTVVILQDNGLCAAFFKREVETDG